MPSLKIPRTKQPFCLEAEKFPSRKQLWGCLERTPPSSGSYSGRPRLSSWSWLFSRSLVSHCWLRKCVVGCFLCARLYMHIHTQEHCVQPMHSRHMHSWKAVILCSWHMQTYTHAPSSIHTFHMHALIHTYIYAGLTQCIPRYNMHMHTGTSTHKYMHTYTKHTCMNVCIYIYPCDHIFQTNCFFLCFHFLQLQPLSLHIPCFLVDLSTLPSSTFDFIFSPW